MKYPTCLLLILLAISCTPTSIKAVYLVQGPSQLSSSDLQAHPEVVVANTFSDLKQRAQTRVALWIDKNATTLIDGGWLDQAPQMYYPIVLVGYNDTLYSFKYVLHICCFSGPAGIDWNAKVLEPGFSVIQREGANGIISGATYIQGYNQTSRVQDILNITNALLENTLKPTATAIVTASMPTPPPLMIKP